jgi:hypothetical protein
MNQNRDTVRFGNGYGIEIRAKSADWSGNILETHGQVFYKDYYDPITIKIKVPIVVSSRDKKVIDFELHTDLVIEFEVQNQLFQKGQNS